jgi:hypothetical protein
MISIVFFMSPLVIRKVDDRWSTRKQVIWFVRPSPICGWDDGAGNKTSVVRPSTRHNLAFHSTITAYSGTRLIIDASFLLSTFSEPFITIGEIFSTLNDIRKKDC